MIDDWVRKEQVLSHARYRMTRGQAIREAGSVEDFHLPCRTSSGIASMSFTNCVVHASLRWDTNEGCSAALQALLQAGANVNKRKIDGITALMLAALEGHSAILQTLLQAGAKIDMATTEGKTSMMFAAEDGCTNTLRALL